LPAEAAPSFLLVDELPAAGATLTLPEEEGHYLTRVCRARAGERATATDGRGGLATVRVREAGRRVEVEVETCDRTTPARAAWVLAGAAEAARGDWMVEKLAELGVTVFQPVDCERGCWKRMKGRAARWRRLAVAALRQSRRRFLMEVRAPLRLGDALASLPDGAGSWLADPAGPAAAMLIPPREGVAIGLVGPAAGLTEGELATAAALHFRPISLADGRLRAETAALAWASWWSGGAQGALPPQDDARWP
jgi:16S rRNA (uracil1498-N3)-methyltransferase